MMDWVPRSVNVLEFVWFLTGAIPLARGLRFLWVLRQVQLAIRRENRGEADEITITTHIGGNWIIAFGHTVIAAIGVAAMLITPANPSAQPRDTTPTMWVITVGLFLLSLTLAVKSQWNQTRWGTITRYVDAHADEIRTLRGVGETVARQEQIMAQQVATMARLEAALAENTAISTHAADRAEAVYHVSNDMNAKIAAAITLGNEQTEALSHGRTPPRETTE